MKNYFTIGLRTIFLLLVLTSCNEPVQSDMDQMPPQETDFMELHREDANISISYPGMLEGSVNVDVKAQVTGYLEEIFVSEGDYVQEGQNLFRIKADVYNEQVLSNDAALKAAQASQAISALEIERLKPLVEARVISEIQLKEAQTKYEVATAQASQAKAALGSSRINANFTLIKAPVSGFIGRIPNRTGNLVTPSDALPLTTLSDINMVYVYFSMTESDFINNQTNKVFDDSVTLILANGSNYSQKGKLVVASGNVDRSTGSIALKAVFSNPNKVLRAGGSGRVLLNKTISNAILIPKLSVKDIQDRYFVFKLSDSNKVSMTQVDFSGSTGDFFIVTNGIQAGDKISINRIDVLNEGSEVVPHIVGSKEQDKTKPKTK